MIARAALGLLCIALVATVVALGNVIAAWTAVMAGGLW